MTVADLVNSYYAKIQAHGCRTSADSRVRYYLNNAAGKLAAKDITLAHLIKGRIYEGEPHGCSDADLEALAPFLEGKP